MRQQPEAPKILVDIRQSDDRPLSTKAAFTPQNLGAAIGSAFKPSRIVVFDVGELMAAIDHVDHDWTNAANPCPADFAVANWIEQNRESAKVIGVQGSNTAQRHSILELALVCRRRNDRRVDCQNMKSRTIDAAVVAKLDDVPLADLIEDFVKLVVVATFSFANRVEERIPDFSRDIERLPRLCFLESIGHGQTPMPRALKSPYS